MQQATMNLNNLTVVDHAFIDEHGNVVGGSFNPSFLVSGDIDPVEKVVVDFSTIKKMLKSQIDDKQLGFDHKLWIIENYSKCTISSAAGNFPIELPLSFDGALQCAGNVELLITTPNCVLVVPRDAVKFIKNYDSSYSIDSAGMWIEEYLHALNPHLDIECFNNIEAHTLYPNHVVHYFAYAHGLKDSTSWGCQNIAHGHLSYLIVKSKTNQALADKLAEKIVEDLDCTIFINSDNLDNLSDDWVDISYTSQRGTFKGSFRDNDRQKCVILETETTIEYLVSFVANKYREELLAAGVVELIVSEGLSKGALINL